jgi:large subunit ribosomal protein L9
MQVILQQDVKGHGKKGELVTVSDGYARNFLIPRKMAVPATNQNISEMKNRDAAKARQLQILKDEAAAIAEKLPGLMVKIKARAGTEGKLFGSVTAKEIADELKEQHGVDIDRRKIVLDEPIRQFGTYEVDVKLHAEIGGKINLLVHEG